MIKRLFHKVFRIVSRNIVKAGIEEVAQVELTEVEAEQAIYFLYRKAKELPPGVQVKPRRPV